MGIYLILLGLVPFCLFCFILPFYPQPKAMEKDRKLFSTKEIQTVCCTSLLEGK